jgi:hypothetical protein
MMNPQNIAFYSFAIVSGIILLFAFVVLWKIFKNQINLGGLLAEPAKPTDPPGAPQKASLSRFQFLIFTFVVAGLFLLLSIEAGSFVEIPNNVLALLGISGGTYVISKTISK